MKNWFIQARSILRTNKRARVALAADVVCWTVLIGLIVYVVRG